MIREMGSTVAAVEGNLPDAVAIPSGVVLKEVHSPCLKQADLDVPAPKAALDPLIVQEIAPHVLAIIRTSRKIASSQAENKIKIYRPLRQNSHPVERLLGASTSSLLAVLLRVITSPAR